MYYRTPDKFEVDFVILLPDSYRVFCRLPAAPRYLIYTCDTLFIFGVSLPGN